MDLVADNRIGNWWVWYFSRTSTYDKLGRSNKEYMAVVFNPFSCVCKNYGFDMPFGSLADAQKFIQQTLASPDVRGPQQS